jgi:hypothetical protein
MNYIFYDCYITLFPLETPTLHVVYLPCLSSISIFSL